jgi:peptidoglycan/xylan/chitin deacetylase (PgdA/CDA1 family)
MGSGGRRSVAVVRAVAPVLQSAVQSRRLATVLAARSRAVLFAAPPSRPAVALTYDDGPHPRLTPALLDVLRRHRAAATFFLIGDRAAEHPGLVGRVVAEGSEVANHTWAERASVLLPPAAFERDLLRTDAVLRAAGGEPRFLRPGSGWVRPSMLRTARRHGYRVVLGSVAVVDLAVADVERSAGFVLSRVQPGSVVVLHEGHAGRAGVVPLTDRLLAGLTDRGLAAVTLSDLFAGVPVARAGQG